MACRRTLVVALSWLLLFLVVCPSALGQDAKVPHYQFKKGDTIAFTVVNTTAMKITQGQDEVFQSTVMKADLVWHVSDVDKNGKAKLNGKLERIHMAMTTGVNPQMTEVLFDSEDNTAPRNADVATIITPLMSKGLSWEMDRQGNVSGVAAPEEVVKYFQGLVGGPPAEAWATEILHGLFHPSGLVFPGAAPVKGKEWAGKPRDLQLDDGIKITQQPQFSLGDVEEREGRKLRNIALKPKVTLELGEKAKQLGLKMTVDSASGTVLFDNAAGKIAGGNVSYEFTLEGMGLTPMVMNTRQFITFTPTKKKQ